MKEEKKLLECPQTKPAWLNHIKSQIHSVLVGWSPNCRNAACHFLFWGCFPSLSLSVLFFWSSQSVQFTLGTCWSSPWNTDLTLVHKLPQPQETLLCHWPLLSPRRFISHTHLREGRGTAPTTPSLLPTICLRCPPTFRLALLLHLPLSWAVEWCTLL